MDLVHEEQGPFAHPPALARGLEHLTQIGDAGENRGERLEGETDLLRQQPRHRGLAAAGRSPEDHRRDLAVLEHAADRRLRPDQMVLADDLIELPRPQPVGQWPWRVLLEEARHLSAPRWSSPGRYD